jgi:hypothetical protein
MVVNFMARGISRCIRKLARTLTLIIKKKKQRVLSLSILIMSGYDKFSRVVSLFK